jgi:subfamily B ATP-binding cassette protein MsbA
MRSEIMFIKKALSKILFWKKNLPPLEGKKTKYDSTKYLTLRLMKEHMARYRLKFALNIFLMFLVAAATSGQAYMIKPAVDLMFKENNKNLLYLVPLAVIIITIVKGFTQYFQVLTMDLLTARISTDMRLRLYSHHIYADMETFNKTSSGKLISSVTNDINAVMGAVSILMNGSIKQTITVITLIIVMFKVNSELALIAFIVIPFCALPVILITKKLKNLSHKTISNTENFTSQMDDTLKAAKLVKSYNAEDFEVKRMGAILDDMYKIRRKTAKLSQLSSPFIETISGIGIALVIFYGGAKVMAGETTPGAFFAFFASMAMAYKPMRSVANLNLSFQMGLVSVRNYFTTIDKKPTIVDSPKAKELDLDKVKGDIEFKNVSFNYLPEYPERKALNHINLYIPSGKKVALVGPSGGGKSTIMNMILRFYDADSGNVLLDGVSIKDLKIKSLRSAISMVSQEVQLFDDTIKENIRYCKQDASDEDIIKAAKLAQAYDFIMEQPLGFDTFIGQSGTRLSGGQRQRISIARAILFNAPILLLDEATSSLDAISEREIKRALDELTKDRTTLVIAHRLSTVINSDKICVIKDGVLVEEGTHKELMKKNGEYANLYSKQFEE